MRVYKGVLSSIMVLWGIFGGQWGLWGNLGLYGGSMRVYKGVLGSIMVLRGIFGDQMGTMRDFETHWRLYEGYMGVSRVQLWYYGVF